MFKAIILGIMGPIEVNCTWICDKRMESYMRKIKYVLKCTDEVIKDFRGQVDITFLFLCRLSIFVFRRIT